MVLSQLDEIITLQQEYLEKKEKGITRNIDFDDERLIDFTVQDFSRWLELCKKRFTSKNILMKQTYSSI